MNNQADNWRFGVVSQNEGRPDRAGLVVAKRASWILRRLLRAVESHRNVRKMSWPRPWSRYHLGAFQSFRVPPAELLDLIELADASLEEYCLHMPVRAWDFWLELRERPQQLLAFVSVHQYFDLDGNRFEGTTLSLGRLQQSRFWDRFDIIVESRIQGESGQDSNRLRIYVDPYSEGSREPLWTDVIDRPGGAGAAEPLDRLGRSCWACARHGSGLSGHWGTCRKGRLAPDVGDLLRSQFDASAASKAPIRQAGGGQDAARN